MRPIFVSFSNLKKMPNGQRWKLAGKIALVLAGLFLLSVLGVFAYFAKDLPSPEKINRRVVAESTKIYDRTGEHLLYEVHGEEKRTLISFSEMPDSIKYATIVLEDQDFYSHHGIKISSILRAAFKDFLHKSVRQGGSTITQQFIKNSLLTPERTFTRKIKEVILAAEMEFKFSKDEILGMYLNEVPYGSNAYGIEAAARTFFGKPARELSLEESTLLAALPKAPTYYSPYGSHIDELKARQELALKRMADLGYVTQEQAAEANQVDVFEKVQPYRENIRAPHFVMYIKEYLENKYGKEAVEQGGLKVYTTLDIGKQEAAEKAVREGVGSNLAYWGATNAALVAVDPKTGQILAMVGSKDYFDKTIDGQVNVTIRDRQPGSSFKPYVYATAFSKGYTPETILFDVETEFETGTDEYKPRNYDGRFRGPVKIKEALGMSLNLPAVKTLYLAGVQNSIATAKRMGITTLNQPERYGLSLVLGGGEVKLLDHTSAFGVFATGGTKHSKTAILRIESSQGEILEEHRQSPGERVMEEKYTAMVNHILSTNDYRAPVFGDRSVLRFDDRQVAVKTGTTNEFRDGWTVGYIPSLAVGVWAGNNDNSPMRAGADGVNVAAPIWRAFMDAVLANYAKENFPDYKKEETGKPVLDGKLDIKKDVEVCKIPGKDDEYCMANKYCLDKKKRDFADIHAILWYVNKDDPRGDYPKEPQNDPQFKKWEKAVQNWLKGEDDYVSAKPPEKECDKDDFSRYFPKISVSVPNSVSSNKLAIKAEADAPYGIDSVEFFVSGEKIGSLSNKPFQKTYTIPEEKNNSNITVEVKVTDKIGNTASDRDTVSVKFPEAEAEEAEEAE
jgi:1A family penicillin-binding protein